MYTETLNEKTNMGLHKFTGSNRGLFYANEREEVVPSDDADGTTHTQFVYDVYEIPDARFPDAVKDAIVSQTHTCNAEHKIMRKAIAILAKKMNMYDDAEMEEFKVFNDFVENF